MASTMVARGIFAIVSRARLALLTFILGVHAPPSIAQEIWFGPLLPRAPHTHVNGISDWGRLFEPGAGWPVSAAGTHVFHITPNYVVDASDEDLLRVKDGAARMGMVIEVGIQSIAVAPSENCGKTEGYADLRVVAAAVGKMKRVGMKPAYVSMDEPVWFGHYAAGPKNCQFSIDEVARRTAETVRRFVEAFPEAALGDIANVPVLTLQPDWQSSYEEFQSLLEHAVGRKIQYLQLDVDWRNPAWPDHMKRIAQFTKARGLKLGIIYNSDGYPKDDVSWIAQAQRNFLMTESEYGIIPDQAYFVTWNKFPTHALPETSPSAHTWLIKQYLLPRTRLTTNASAPVLEGRLIDAARQGVVKAAIQIDELGADPTRYPTAREVTATVPTDATSALIAIRINRECFCVGYNDVLVGDFAFTEYDSGNRSFIYSLPAEFAKQRGFRSQGVDARRIQIDSRAVVRMTVPPDRTFAGTSSKFAVTPGAAFTFRVPMASLTANGVFGTAAIIWLDSQGRGLRRTNVTIEAEERQRLIVTTDNQGRFAATNTLWKDGGRGPFRLHYAGSETMRGAYARVP